MSSKTLSLLAFLFILVALSSAKYIEFVATLNGMQEVAPVPTLAEGTGTFELHYEDNNRLEYEIEMEGFASFVTAAHLHGKARIGANADVIFELEVKNDNEISGSLTLNDEQAADLKRGLYYINVHTVDNPNGEIRGQILTTHTIFNAVMSGQHMVPQVQTPADGVATFKIDYEDKKLTYEITHSVKDANAAHIHGPATEGNNAAVLYTFKSSESPIKGTHLLTDQQLEFLRDSLTYVVVHSENAPDGEIRGQIVPNGEVDLPNGWEWLFTGALILLGLAIIATVVIAGAVIWKKRDSIKKILNKKKPSDNPLGDGISQAPLIETEIN